MSTDSSEFSAYCQRLQNEVQADNGTFAQAQLDGAAVYLEFVREWISSQGNGTWVPPAKSTIKQKQEDGLDPSATMKRSGALERSFTPGDPHNILRVTDTGIEMGSSLPYAIIQQKGARNLPARSLMVDPPPQVKQQMDDVLAKGIEKILE